MLNLIRYRMLTSYLDRLLAAGQLTEDQHAALVFRLDLIYYTTPAPLSGDLTEDLISDTAEATRSNLYFSTNMPLADC